MLDRADADESRQASWIKCFLHEDQQVSGELQPDARHRHEQEQGLFEGWIAVNQTTDFLIDLFDGLGNLLDHVLVRVLGEFRRDLLAVDRVQGVLMSRQLYRKVLARGQQ